MPFQFKVKTETKHIVVKYDGTLKVNLKDIITCREIKLKTTTDRMFMLGCIAGGAAVAAIGATYLILKNSLNLSASLFALKCAIFEVTIPNDHEKEFEEYVDKKLIADLQREFENIESHLTVLGIKTGYSVDQDMIIKQLKYVKIDSVERCGQDIAEKAFKDMYVKKALINKRFYEPPTKKLRPTIKPPTSLNIRKGPKSPSTQIFASYDTVEGADGYIVTAHDLESGKKVQKSTPDGFCIVDGLEAGHSYVLGVKSVCNGTESSELLMKDFVQTALYDPFPWITTKIVDDSRSIKTKATLPTHYSGSTADQTSKVGSSEFIEKDDLPELWSSSLHVELKKIFRKGFDGAKMKRFLAKCDELGITEVGDLKFIECKEVAEQFKGTVKMVEILKLIDYAQAQGQYAKEERTNLCKCRNSLGLA
uniref:uncharacterized protein LOC120334761 n=1 Tax=Styela clava TaxID=7725 RepID=UPI00193A0CE6|nr:uncharacterized protein LOC120334761 [Styela clava]